jgi:hypothetical protein
LEVVEEEEELLLPQQEEVEVLEDLQLPFTLHLPLQLLLQILMPGILVILFKREKECLCLLHLIQFL